MYKFLCHSKLFHCLFDPINIKRFLQFEMPNLAWLSQHSINLLNACDCPEQISFVIEGHISFEIINLFLCH
jgi:hypothetical protein